MKTVNFHFMENHEQYMHRCIQLAANAAGDTYPNPMVGSVIVYGDRIIGEGWHRRAGEPHAEVNAINSVRQPELLKGSTLYVSLEPCAHYGKTPPCAVRIVQEGIPRVVIGAMDPNVQVNGKGKKILEDAVIEVTAGVLEKECLHLNRRFFTFQTKNRPYIILKWAQTADGFLDNNFQPAAISNSLVRTLTHRMRAGENAILVGTRTALNDNPSLTTREIPGANPVRVLIDLDLKVPKMFNIFSGEATTLVFNLHQDAKEANVEWIKVYREYLIPYILKSLAERKIQSVIVEGGLFTLQQFINHKLWDEAMVITNDRLYFGGGTAAPQLSTEAAAEEIYRDNRIAHYINHPYGV